jgi:CrcB protein
MPDRQMVVAVFVGGAVGTLARAVLSSAFPLSTGHRPWPTFLVNIGGAFLLGYLPTRLQGLPLSSYRRRRWAPACVAG